MTQKDVILSEIIEFLSDGKGKTLSEIYNYIREKDFDFLKKYKKNAFESFVRRPLYENCVGRELKTHTGVYLFYSEFKRGTRGNLYHLIARKSAELIEHVLDADYIEKVNQDHNSKELTEAPKWVDLSSSYKENTIKLLRRNITLAKKVISDNDHVCLYGKLIGENHITFTNAVGENYMEAHHLIPLSAQFDNLFLDGEGYVNLDVYDNLIPLCPICHAKIHHASKIEKKRMIDVIFQYVELDVIDITIDDIYYFYSIV
ncbi:HNH endonuclease [Mycoplasmatota bacterium zrk1]